jgi:AcrR family transcriptional regulator
MDGMPRLSQRTRDARRDQILGAARRCFTRNGFQATSMQDIFAESGLSAGAVYSHFTGKYEIITAIAEEVVAKVAAAADTTLADGAPPSLAEVLEYTVNTLWHADIAPIAVIVWGEAICDPALRERLSALYRTLTDHFTELVRRCQASGTIDPDIPPEYPAQVLTAIGPAFIHQLAFGAPTDAHAFTRGLRALLPPPPPPPNPPGF